MKSSKSVNMCIWFGHKLIITMEKYVESDNTKNEDYLIVKFIYV